MAVGKLQTQTELFWKEEYEVSQGDLDLVAGLILEAGKPQLISMLAAAVVARRYQREKDAAAQYAKSGEVYQPKGCYTVGQRLVFTALDFATGEVVAVRPGANPKYGPFNVIRVALADGGPEREFACELDIPHPLNRPAEELLGQGDETLSESDLVQSYAGYVEQRLEHKLLSTEEFVRFNGMWFLRELLPDIHVGYLNLAEAMIYEAGTPLAAEQMLHDLDLDPAGSRDAQLFALNCALGQDERFDNVSLDENPVWFLRVLEPAAAFARPRMLQPAFRATGGEYIGLTMLDLIEQIGDELDDIEGMLLHQNPALGFEVSAPHLYAGTMPLTLQLARLLPASRGNHFSITIADGRNDQRFMAWVVPGEHYIAGLGNWYHEVGMCVGGRVTVAVGPEPRMLTLTVKPSKGKRADWLRLASVEEGKLALQMQRGTVEVDCDRDMLISLPDADVIESYMAANDESKLPISTVVLAVFEELAKFGSRGIVHAKSIYSTANLMRRSGAVPIFAELTRRACFDPVGNGYWAFDRNLERVTYRSPEEMRERPFSNRTDAVKDPVIQYLGR